MICVFLVTPPRTKYSRTENQVSRETRFTVYVSGEIMDEPVALTDAVMAHLIKKEVFIAERKRFLAEAMKAVGKENALAVIDQWVQVRDVETFPFQQQAAKTEVDAPPTTPGNANQDAQQPPEGDNVPKGDSTPYEGKKDADTAIAGGVPVDGKPVGGKKSRTTSK